MYQKHQENLFKNGEIGKQEEINLKEKTKNKNLTEAPKIGD